jgi:hypothetical protein
VTTGSASVTNTGTIYNAYLNFTIPQGPIGPQGPTGSQGNPGNNGSNGAKGDTGTAATITIGTVTTGSAAVTNTGSAYNAVLNFTLPQGPQGATGPQGPGANQALDTTSTVSFVSVTGNVGTVGTSTTQIGYLNIPQNKISTASGYTFVLGDQGKHVYSTATSGQNISIPTNSSVGLRVGSNCVWNVICTEFPQWTLVERDRLAWSGPFVFYENRV